jgi:hypothetical protein
MSVPVLIVCYKRAENVRKLLTDLQEQGVSRIYLAIDGSKDSDQSVQNLIETDAMKFAQNFNIDLRIWKRNLNLGPAVSVITAIDWLFSYEKSGVILEDDLVISNELVSYFQNMLVRYEPNPNVMMLSGTQFIDSHSQEQLCWSSYPVIWGWATWSDRWRTCREYYANLERINWKVKGKERRFWKTGVRRCDLGIQDAWDVPLAAIQLSIGSKTILPPVNLISNRGADEHAGNTLAEIWPLSLLIHKLPQDYDKMEFNLAISGTSMDEEIKTKVYNLENLLVLPLFFSITLDYFRYPKRLRKYKLGARLNDVHLPD